MRDTSPSQRSEGRRVGDEGSVPAMRETRGPAIGFWTQPCVAASVDINSPPGLFWAGLNESDFGRLWHCRHTSIQQRGAI